MHTFLTAFAEDCLNAFSLRKILLETLLFEYYFQISFYGSYFLTTVRLLLTINVAVSPKLFLALRVHAMFLAKRPALSIARYLRVRFVFNMTKSEIFPSASNHEKSGLHDCVCPEREHSPGELHHEIGWNKCKSRHKMCFLSESQMMMGTQNT